MGLLNEVLERLDDGDKLYILRIVETPANKDKDFDELILNALAERGVA